MGKYIFQNGGEQQQAPLVVESDSGVAFNNYLDNLIQQPVPQQPQLQRDDTPAKPEESDYIKNLRAEANAKDEAPSNNYDERLYNIEKNLNDLSSSINQKQTELGWAASDDGFDYTRSIYDKGATTPVFNAPSIPTDVKNTISNHYTMKNNAANALSMQQLQQRQMMAESGGSNTAVSSAGAVGAYQFMPSTWDQYKPRPDAVPTNRQDAQEANTNYMSALTKQFDGNQRQAVAAYNWGPSRVAKVVSNYGEDWENHLPEETKGYLNNVFSNDIKTADGANISNVSPDLLNVVGTLSKQFNGIAVTSGTEGKHMNNSAHYDGEAVDIGANSSNKAAYQKFVQSLPQLQQQYGIKYINEGDHIHISLSTHDKT